MTRDPSAITHRHARANGFIYKCKRVSDKRTQMLTYPHITCRTKIITLFPCISLFTATMNGEEEFSDCLERIGFDETARDFVENAGLSTVDPDPAN